MKGVRLAHPMDFAMQRSRFGSGIGARLGPSLRKHWRSAGGGALLLAGAAVLLIVSHGRLAAAVTPYPHELAQVAFAVAGDVIPHEAVRAAADAAAASGDPSNSQGWGALFSDVSDVFE